MDQQADRVGRVSLVGRVTQVGPISNMDRRTYQASWVDRVSRVSSTEQKIGGSSRVANTRVWVTENLANTESRVMENSANTESRATENSQTQKAGLGKIQLTQKTGLYRTRGARNQKKEKVLLQAKG
jgi:hypothetical protein